MIPRSAIRPMTVSDAPGRPGCRSTAPARARSAPEAGFSLIELLVSLALLAILTAMIPSTLQLARREARMATELDKRAGVEAALTFVEQRLTETSVIYERGEDGRLRIIFNGAADALTFISPMMARTLDGGLARFELKIGSDGEGRNGLVLVWSPWRPAPASGDPTPAPQPQSRLLVADAKTLALRYFGSASSGEAPDWSETWQRPDLIPAVVEIALTVGAETKVRATVLRLKTPD